MDRNQDVVYDAVRELIYTDGNYTDGVTTDIVAEHTQLQRTNTSALLNKLVRLGKLKKTKTRPVHYQLDEGTPNTDAFSTLVGANGSLKKAIQLAKAAVLYPSGNLNIQITAQTGSGTSAMVERIIQFAEANQMIDQKAPHVVVNCRNYAENIHSLDTVLFGPKGDYKGSCFEQARNGILFINHYEYLQPSQKSEIIDLLDRKAGAFDPLAADDKTGAKTPFMIFSCSNQANQQLERKLPVTIKLPVVDERPLNEKLALINHFFVGEAKTSQRKIIVSTTVVKALLLADYFHNVKDIMAAVTIACAKAYVRVVNEPGRDINVYLDDLKPVTQKALLKEKENRPVLDALFEDSETMIFTPETAVVTRDEKKPGLDLYGDINKQYALLVGQGVGSKNIKHVISDHIKKLFERYNYNHRYDLTNSQEQLAKIVKPEIITTVKTWLDNCSKVLHCTFEPSVFYGLCLHINSLLTINITRQRMSSEQAKKLIDQYPAEYKESVKLAQILNDNLQLNLSPEETVLLMMFLIDSKDETPKGHPVVLYIMHGNGAAKSLSETTNTLNQNNYAYGYDMNLDVSTTTAMGEIKALIQKIDQGEGVIVIYDMGSIKVMIDTISQETNIKLRTIQLPITLIGIDAARKSSMETDIDYVYHLVTTDAKNMFATDQKKEEIIVTLCHTGEGGAAQLKDYIDQNSLLGIRVKALAMSDKQELTNEIIALRKIYQIHAFVGVYDPQLFGIPYIPISKVFENSRQNLDQILSFKPLTGNNFAYDQIYNYFREQFKFTSIAKLQQLMPDIMDQLVTTYDLGEDQRIGLFVHLGSLVERTLAGNPPTVEARTATLISKYPDDYKFLRRTLKPLEKHFKLIISDDEIATVLMIVRKL